MAKLWIDVSAILLKSRRGEDVDALEGVLGVDVHRDVFLEPLIYTQCQEHESAQDRERLRGRGRNPGMNGTGLVRAEMLLG